MGIFFAILYKEWISFKHRIVFSVGFSGAVVAIAATRPSADARYSAIVVGLATSLMSLKFWEERGLGTLDTLLALPSSARKIFLAKVSFSCLVGIIFSALALTLHVLSEFLRGGTPNISSLIALPLVGATTYGACSIVGYVMWSFSEQAAKITQITILALLAIGFASAFSDGINISALVWIAILALIAGILCVKWIDVERIVLNLE